MRDEGTSFHYAPASDEIEVNKRYKEEFRELLKEYGCAYTEGKVWTTDGIYRETREKMLRRKEEGCICGWFYKNASFIVNMHCIFPDIVII